MTHTLTAPTPAAAFRRLVERVRADPDSKSTAIGLMAVLIVHLLLFLIAPYLLRTDVVHATVRKQAIPRQFNIEIAPDEFVTPAVKPPPSEQVRRGQSECAGPRPGQDEQFQLEEPAPRAGEAAARPA